MLNTRSRPHSFQRDEGLPSDAVTSSPVNRPLRSPSLPLRLPISHSSLFFFSYSFISGSHKVIPSLPCLIYTFFLSFYLYIESLHIGPMVIPLNPYAMASGKPSSDNKRRSEEKPVQLSVRTTKGLRSDCFSTRHGVAVKVGR